MSQLRVCLTGAGAPGTAGTIFALQEGARDSNMQIKIFGFDVRDSVSPLKGLEDVFQVPPPEDRDYVTHINHVIVRNRIDVLIPQTTREVNVLSQCVGSIACPVLVSPWSAVRVAGDKGALVSLFKKIGLPHPDFRRPRDRAELIQAVGELGYPEHRVVAKLVGGSGGRGVRILQSGPESYAQFAHEKPTGYNVTFESFLRTLEQTEQWPDLLVTKHVSGIECSVDAYLGSGRVIVVPRQRDEVRSGISFDTKLVDNPEIERIVTLIARILGLRGVFGFQFILQGRTPMILECNPRIQGTMVASLLSGYNLIWRAMCDVLGRPQGDDDVPQRRHGRCSRYWGFTLSQEP